MRQNAVRFRQILEQRMGKNVRVMLNAYAISGTVKFVGKPDILPACLDKDDDFPGGATDQ